MNSFEFISNALIAMLLPVGFISGSKGGRINENEVLSI